MEFFRLQKNVFWGGKSNVKADEVMWKCHQIRVGFYHFLFVGILIVFGAKVELKEAKNSPIFPCRNKPLEVLTDVICFCIANKRENTDWVHLPVSNFDCYYGNTNFSKKRLSNIPNTIIEREVSSGISRAKLKTSSPLWTEMQYLFVWFIFFSI